VEVAPGRVAAWRRTASRDAGRALLLSTVPRLFTPPAPPAPRPTTRLVVTQVTRLSPIWVTATLVTALGDGIFAAAMAKEAIPVLCSPYDQQ
jgi:hypothetical protein